MRAHAVVGSASGLRPFAHLGWAYGGRDDFMCRAGEYLADGLSAGQRVEYVGAGDHAALEREFAGLPRGAAALRAGHAQVSTLAQFYAFAADTEVVDPVESVRKRVQATQEALAAGYSGFRAIVDATAMVLTVEQRDAFAGYEYLLDQQMSVSAVSTLCAFELPTIGASAAAELVCLHPYINPDVSLFQMYADDSGGGAQLCVAGELDMSCETEFDTTLTRLLRFCDESELVIDGHDLDFIDHRSLALLDHHLAQRGARGVLRTNQAVVTRLAGLLGLQHLEVTTTGHR